MDNGGGYPGCLKAREGIPEFPRGSSVPSQGWNEIPGIVRIGVLRGTKHQQELKALRHQECDEEVESHPCPCFSWKAVPPDAALYKAKCMLPSGMQDGGRSRVGWRNAIGAGMET